ncbi:MAG TPA: hypothetical protein VKB23_03925 [Solirubrobacterales bacterium]|nr:hypothetical protein [Solirubrobacterales bacterium]
MQLPPPKALLLAAAVLLAGCGSTPTRDKQPSLLHGDKSGYSASTFAPATRLAQRFASSYARSVYLRRPPRLPGATPALTVQLAQAATRVPPSRRNLRPHAVAIDLTPVGRTALRGNVEIADGRSPIFSVGFTLRRSPAGWRVVSASPPG